MKLASPADAKSMHRYKLGPGFPTSREQLLVPALMHVLVLKLLIGHAMCWKAVVCIMCSVDFDA